MKKSYSIDIAKRLSLLCSNFICDEYTSIINYYDKKLPEWNLAKDELIYQYELHIRAFIEIAFTIPHEKTYFENLVLISDDCLIYSFSQLSKKSIKILERQGENFSFSEPKNDIKFLEKFLFISFRIY